MKTYGVYYNCHMQKEQNLSDEALVEEVRTKDKEKYTEIVERYQSNLLRYAWYLLNDEQKAQDIVQEAFIKAYINLNGFNTKKKFSSWIYRIVHNEAMNEMKKHKKEVPMLENMDYQSIQNIEESYSKQEVIKEAEHCLRNLPVIYREPLALYYLDDKSYDDISDILRIPMGTVATRIKRAKVMMKKLCQTNK